LITTIVGATFPAGLTELSLANNRITSLAEVTFPSDLQVLRLNANQMTTLGGAVFPAGLGTVWLDDSLRDRLGEATFLSQTSVCLSGASCVLYGPSVGLVAVSGVAVNPASSDAVVGEKVRLSATITPNTASDTRVRWASLTPGVATVDGTGLVTAVSAGTAVIIVTTNSGEKTAFATIVVTAPPSTGGGGNGGGGGNDPGPGGSGGGSPDPVPGDPDPGPGDPGVTVPGPGGDGPGVVAATGIVLSVGTARLAVGSTVTLTAALVPVGANGGPVTWVSSKPGIATVDGNGTIRGVKPGKTTVSATWGQFATSASVTVTKAGAKVQAKVPASAKMDTKTTVKVKVGTGGGAKLTGKVKVTLTKGKVKATKTVTVKPKNNAKYVTITLPKVTQPGRYRLTITYLGNGTHAKTAITKKITIK
jgi:uncharacterized protein YjdB